MFEAHDLATWSSSFSFGFGMKPHPLPGIDAFAAEQGVFTQSQREMLLVTAGHFFPEVLNHREIWPVQAARFAPHNRIGLFFYIDHPTTRKFARIAAAVTSLPADQSGSIIVGSLPDLCSFPGANG